MKKLLSITFTFLVSLLLSGCFSDMLKPAENHDAFYMLPIYNKAKKQKFAEVNMQVLSAPDYLKRPQIVVKAQEANGIGNVAISETHRWIEPISNGIARTLTANLESQGILLFAYPALSDAQKANLKIYIDDLIGSLGGDVVLNGKFQLHSGDKISTIEFNLTEKSADNSYASYVDAIGKLIAKLSEKITKEVTKF